MMRVLTILLILLPFPALAEGARMMLDCSVVTRCVADADCAPVSEDIYMEISPRETAEDGSGTYVVSWRHVTSIARGESRTGPFFWTQGEGRPHSLTLTSETTAVMIQQNFNIDPQGPVATIDILECKVTV